MEQDSTVFETLFAHDGGTYLTESYTVSPTVSFQYEARWDSGAVGVRNDTFVIIEALHFKVGTIEM